jgi:elongation factor Ts
MTITAEQVKSLRDRTGAGMMECKKALAESAGDVEKAIDLLRKAGLQRAEKRQDRTANQGLVEAYIHPGNRVGVLIEVNCETDFVARTPEFQELVRNLAMQVAALKAEFVSREDVPAERVAKEREIYVAQLAEQKKPANIIEKIVEGKLDKFYGECCLLEQAYMRDDTIKVGDLVTGLSGRTGEKMAVRRFVRFELGKD